MENITSSYESRFAARGDLAGLRFIDPLLRADSDRAELVRDAVEQGRCIAALDGEGVAGYAVLSNRFLGQPFVDLLIVGPAHRRQGIATLLLREAEKKCGGPKLFTSCNRSNLPAQCLFEKCGFQRSGQIYNWTPATRNSSTSGPSTSLQCARSTHSRSVGRSSGSFPIAC
jgi:GNAT superfamily N-acetyltransferase